MLSPDDPRIADRNKKQKLTSVGFKHMLQEWCPKHAKTKMINFNANSWTKEHQRRLGGVSEQKINRQKAKKLEMRGIEPRTYCMRNNRATTVPHPHIHFFDTASDSGATTFPSNRQRTRSVCRTDEARRQIIMI